nr:MATE family efflux transporter [Pseudoramibacter sp. HA2172]
MKQKVTRMLRDGGPSALKQKSLVALRLSLPAMMAQLTAIIMQYIDSAMVGALGAEASAAIGLVSPVIWLIDGLTFAAVYGFTVQIAHQIGAKHFNQSRSIFRLGAAADLIFSAGLMLIGLAISVKLPFWLGASGAVAPGASQYFIVYALFLPFIQLERLAGTALQASGNMKVPAIFEGSMCVLDVLFNALLIFPGGVRHIGALAFYLPGAGLGVLGAALGTAFSRVVIMGILLYYGGFKTESLRFKRGEQSFSKSEGLRRAGRIFWPACLERIFINGAMILTTWIIAPLGTIAIAANAFATTAESVCYMPGFGVASAASTLVGQRAPETKNLPDTLPGSPWPLARYS